MNIPRYFKFHKNDQNEVVIESTLNDTEVEEFFYMATNGTLIKHFADYLKSEKPEQFATVSEKIEEKAAKAIESIKLMNSQPFMPVLINEIS